MAIERVPFFVGGGFEHSAEIMRSALYAATGDANGVVSPGDLKVRESPVPGSSVQVMPGTALLPNSYGGGDGQSYVVRGSSLTDVPIQATGSSGGRSDLVIVRVDDPTYQGTNFDPATFDAAGVEVIAGVGPETLTAQELVDYPHHTLCRIDIPPSTATITDSMIWDARWLATSQKDYVLRIAHPSGDYEAGTDHRIPKDVYTSWPIRVEERPSVWVPWWATHMIVTVDMMGLQYVPGTVQPAHAGIRTGFGSDAGNNGIITEDQPERSRKFYSVVGEHFIPESRRRSNQLVNVQALRTAGGSTWSSDYQSQVSIRIDFFQRTV